ncbi:hypothetical protein Acr_01g0011950 [Actinidia rufa]|uniref:Pectinesterase inhibitor domain-containing protein n=1 Tax=Actinidia rufa TaxID=165716 RepID=A0A7J0E5D2_9ERIC|nr:hypothetical protein Acr_01g0011950 [Actinidia rufa]
MRISLSMTRMSLLFLFVVFTLNYHSQSDLIADTCKKTEFPEFCISTLRSNRRSASADVNGLARIVFEAGLAKATSTLNKVNLLLKKTTERILKQCLQICANVYDDALDNISQAIENVGSNNSQAVYYASEASINVEDCEESFDEEPNKRKSPLTGDNNVVDQLVNIGAAIVHPIG